MSSTIIAERYEVMALLGEGGMGAVYKARDRVLDRTVAIKTILPRHVSGQEASQRFFREAQALARLNHPNILTLYDYGQDARLHYLVMELGGRDLGSILAAQGGPLTLEQALKVARSICHALDCAHSRGVIHRDLKPGNILVGSAEEPGWSTRGVDATPVKVMDLGLAKVRGAEAITVVSAHLGTPQYMSPEQALGRDTDERSDLYSFGVVLYELLTGVRPFDSDEPQAIISQHLHMPPVPPSAFNPELPHVLEVLVLRLMEKDPSRRPASAAEVLKALEGMSATGELETATPGGAGGLSPLSILPARTPLVGRNRELDFLKAQYESAAAGRGGSLLLISGDPGIGKTRLARELGLYARMRGGLFLEGRYFKAGTAPYGPYVEALRAGLRGLGRDELAKLVGSHGSELAQILPELVEQIGPFPSPAALGPEDLRLRLYDGIVGLIASLSQRKPFVLFVDDLQWAPEMTVLIHIARRLEDTKAVVLGAYRDHDLREHTTLVRDRAELNQARLFTPVALATLDEEETAQMVAHHFGEKPAGLLRQSVHSKTGGNPFFVEEVVRSLAETGVVRPGNGVWEVVDLAEVRIPESIKMAIEERIARLGEGALEMLIQASVLGQEFSFQALLAMAGLAEDDLVEQIDRAVEARLLVDRTVAGQERYGFSDAQMFEVLYGSITPSRRRRLHLKAGRAIEELYPDRREAHAEDLSRHFTEGNDVEKGADYSYRAGVKADRLQSYRLAIRFYQQALDLWEDLGGHAEERARVCGNLGDVTFSSGIEPHRAMAYFAKALALHGELADRPKTAAAHSQIGREYSLSANLAVRSQTKALEQLHLARTILEELPESPALSSVYTQLAWAHHMLGQLSQVVSWAKKGREVAERLGNSTLIAQSRAHFESALQVIGRAAEGSGLIEQAWQLASQSNAGSVADYVRFEGSISAMRLKNPVAGLAWAERKPDFGSVYSTVRLPEYLAIHHALMGDFARVDRTLAERKKAMEALGDTSADGVSWYLGFVLLHRGEWDTARSFLREALKYYAASQSHHYASLTALWLGQLHLEVGDHPRAEEQLLAALGGFDQGEALLWKLWVLPLLSILYSRTDQLEKAKFYLAEARQILATPQDWHGLAGSVHLAEGIVRVMEGRGEEAEAGFQRAIASDRRYSLRWDEARAYAEWAGALLRCGGESGRGQAKEMLSQSLNLWQSMGLTPYVERCRVSLAKLS